MKITITISRDEKVKPEPRPETWEERMERERREFWADVDARRIRMRREMDEFMNHR